MKHDEYLIEISEKIGEILGLSFQPNQLPDLERRVKAAAKELDFDISISSINDWLSNSTLTDIELKTLSAHLTIGETYFYREKAGLDLFKNKIIPTLIKLRQNNDKQIRIWSAGCSSGEEPYTLAMILKEHFPELSDWNIMILATDISPVAIQKALVGEYTEWSFRDSDTTIKNKYFINSGRNWKIIPEIKEMVTFSYLNLAEKSYPSGRTNTETMDVIFCRNVMMYFTPEVIHEVSDRFYQSITKDGWLITSQVELNSEYFSNFERVLINKGIFYQKSDKSSEPIRPWAIPSFKILPVIKVNQIDKKALPISRHKIIEKIPHPVTKPQAKSQSNETDYYTLYQKGQYEQCIKDCLRIIENGELNDKVFSILVKSYANSGHQTDGQEVIEKVISSNSSTPEMYYLYASFLKEQNNTGHSEIALKKAIYLDHKHLLSHLMLGELLTKKDKKHLAIKHYEIANGLLDEYNDNEIVPESGGLTAGRIKVLTESIINNL